MDIDKMTGKQLGIAVAKEVMGWQERKEIRGDYTGPYPAFHDYGQVLAIYEGPDGFIEPYEGMFLERGGALVKTRTWAPWRSLDDVLEVVEELHASGSRLVLRGPHWGLDSDGQWNAEFVPQHGNNYSFGDDASEAILRAALLAVRSNSDDH